MSRFGRALGELWPWRWLRAGSELLRGVRVHPTAVLQAGAGQLQLARGTMIGARSRVILGDAGRLLTGAAVWISSDVEIQTETQVRIGEGTSIQRRCTLNGSTRVGRGCIFAPNVFVSSGTHVFRATPHLPIQEQERQLRRSGAAAPDRPVWIQDDCWLGVNVVVSPGVTVGKGAVVGANAVVTRDVPPYSVVAGAPARPIGARLAWRPPREIRMNRGEDLVYVLSGVPESAADGSVAGFAASGDDALRFAIAREVAAVTVDYRASHPVTIEAAGARYPLAAGAGRLELPAGALPAAHGAALLDISIVSSPRGATFSVSRVGEAGSRAG